MFNRNRITSCLLMASIMISTCGCSNISSVTNDDINDDTNASVLSSDTTEVSPAVAMDENEEKETASSETTDIADYEYPEKFVLTDSLRGAIEQLAIWYGDEYNAQDAVKDDTWQQFVISTYVQGNWDGYDYLKQIEEQGGRVSKEQLEYIQYSLTGIEISFDDMKEDETIDCFDIVGGSYYGHIDNYTIKSEDENVTLLADFETSASNGSNTQTYSIEVKLEKNPKSCFDGYSIKSMSKTNTTVAQTGDGSERTFWGWDMEFENKEGSHAFEIGRSDEDIDYDGVVYVALSDEQKEYVSENAGEEFIITFIFTEEIEQPIHNVEAISIKKVE